MNLAILLYNEGNSNEALQYVKEVRKINHRNPQALNFLALMFLSQNAYQKAKKFGMNLIDVLSLRSMIVNHLL